MAAERFDIPEHEPYAGSYEAANRLPPREEQDWTSADINLLKAVLANHADMLDAIGVDIGDMDALDGYDNIVAAINGAISANEIEDIDGLEDVLDSLTSAVSTAGANAASALTDAANAQSTADAAAQSATGANALAQTASNIGTSALSAIADLTDPVYGSIATASLTIDDDLVDGRELFKQLFDTTSAEMTVTLDGDLATGQELIINRLAGDNDLLIDAGDDIDFYGNNADPLTLNYRGWVHLKKTATGWITVDHRATDSAAV